jgi:hypothetical protein
MRDRSGNELITKGETAAWLKVCPRTIDYWTAGPRPRLPYVKFGKAKRFLAADIVRFIEKHRVRGCLM